MILLQPLGLVHTNPDIFETAYQPPVHTKPARDPDTGSGLKKMRFPKCADSCRRGVKKNVQFINSN